MHTTVLRSDDYTYTDACTLPAATPRGEVDRLAADLAIYDRARFGGLRVAPDTVPDGHLDLWWSAQIRAAHRSGCIVALRAQPLRQAWAPMWGAAIVRPDDMDRTRAVLVGLRVMADEQQIESMSPQHDPVAVLLDLARGWAVQRGLTLVGAPPVRGDDGASAQGGGGPGEE